jgi:hypothetical protein
MKKLIIAIVFAFLSILSIWNTNAFWTYAENTHLKINWEHIGTWEQILMYWEKDNTLYFHTRTMLSDWKDEYKYFKYTNWELIETEEYWDNKTDFSDSENWTISSHYKQENDNTNYTTKIFIDWKLYWPYNYDYIEIHDISNKAFWYKYWEGRDDYFNVFTYFDKEKTEIKSNIKVDKLLNKVFVKIDKKWEEKAKKTYEALIARLDKLLEKTKNESKKELIEYIKYKVEEKVK